MSDDTYYLKIGTARDLKNKLERRIYRFFEMLTPLISLSILILSVVLSFCLPVWVAFFIILYDTYWLFRTIYFAFYLRAGYEQMKQNEKEDWLKKLLQLPAIQNGLPVQSWQDIYHLVILPMYKEPLEIVEQTFESIKKTDYPKDKIMVVLSYEERARAEGEAVAQAIQKKYAQEFYKLLTTCHPANLEGEIAGHGSNDAWAGKQAKELLIDPLKIPYENIIVSSFDIDSVFYPKYFSCLTYKYLTTEKPCRTSYQPVPLYLNNIWEAPSVSRVFSFSSTFWHTMNQERPEKLITFSSHAMSFKALADVGFKQPNVISDDSRIFWQCFFKYNGDYRVEPLLYPVSMDANAAPNIFTTLKNIYKQQKRWAYGVGEVPYFIFGCLKNKVIPLKKKIFMGFDLIEGHVTWAVSSILIFCLGWLPIFFGGPQFTQTLLSYNLPKITSLILTINMLGLVLSIYLTLVLLPPRPIQSNRLKYVLVIFEWVLVPFVIIFFSALPALHAQLHWLFGKYMGFWVTPKIRKDSQYASQ
ncbi:MAG TPA: glycosyltransferase family 2 protein [Candidatus Pacearchaeota archaeon]|jgi:cellulose synthase/poly-beta-1,6-N-acetylglucosamine synthase-like glycosyltransferase|nr:glycosyltransferase family 2 protein [Candidatus Pacearchaeota archaeon]HQG09149.1 glycosyltransferase family 2 protein [Candidatus Pacearchaeota archaeon]HQH20362.1 glycosyltransferase family 2 protein [Candidatus Pacearchaeota archaeon]HQK58632.1 glycosyltransferase family 2 protein [Candidatus Pacearchaeota archaeon]HRR94780.1 glycosyltransferase family 2 protein [Candidatus Paceibacterota bacterium]